MALTENKDFKPALNDILAMERTTMANERTFLAYIRTSMTLLIPGVTGFQLADSLLLKIVSALFVPLGIVVFIVGVFRFLKKRRLRRLIAKN